MNPITESGYAAERVGEGSGWCSRSCWTVPIYEGLLDQCVQLDGWKHWE